MPTPVAGIILNVNTRGAVVSVQQLGAGLAALQGTATRTGKSVGQMGRATHQGIMNAIQGLQFLQHHLQRATMAMGSFLVESIKVASEVELAFARVAIVMGKTGDRVNDANLVQQYDAIIAKVEELGMKTEFTMQQAAEAFVNLKQAGLDAKDAIAGIDQVMAFASASAGTVNLSQAADTATNAMAALGVSFQDVYKTGGVLDMMVKAQNETKLSLSEMNQVMKSMGAAGSIFEGTDPKAFIGIAALMRTMGRSAAQSGNDIQGMGRSMQQLMKVFLGGQVRGAKQKKFGLSILGMGKEDFVNAQGGFKTLDRIVLDGNKKVRDAIVKHGKAATTAALRMVFGSQQAVNMFLLTMNAQDKLGKTLEGTISSIGSAYGEAKDAQKAFLETTTGLLQRLDGVWQNFRKTLVDSLVRALKPVFKQLIGIIEVVTKWLKDHPQLTKAIISFTVALVGLMGVLSAVLGITVALGFAQMALNTAVVSTLGTLGLGTIVIGIWNAMRVAMLKTLAAMGPLLAGAALFAAAAGIAVLVWQKDIGGLRSYFRSWIQDIQDVWSVLENIIQGKGIRTDIWSRFSPRAKEMAKWVAGITVRFKAFWRGAKEAFMGVMGVAAHAVGWITSVLVFLAETLASVGLDFTKLMLTGKDWKMHFEQLGQVVGSFIGMLLLLKLGMIAFTAATIVVTGVLKAFRMAVLVAKAAVWLFNFAMMANPIGVIAVALIVLVGALIILAYWWDEINYYIKRATGGFFDIYDALLVLTGPIGWVVIALRKLWQSDLNRWLQRVSGGLVDVADVILMFIPIVGWVTIAIKKLIQGLLWLWSAFTETRAYAWLVEAWDTAITALKELWNDFVDWAFDAGGRVADAIADGLQKGWDKVGEGIGVGLDYVKDFFQSSPAKRGPLKAEPMEVSGANLVKLLNQGVQSQMPSLLATVAMMVAPFAGAPETLMQGIMAPITHVESADGPPTNIGGLIRSTSSGDAGDLADPEKASNVINVGGITLNVEVRLDASNVDDTTAKKLAAMVAQHLGDSIEDELSARMLS